MLVCCCLIYYDDYFYTASANPETAVSISQRITISMAASWKGMGMYFILYNAEFEQFMRPLEIPGKMSCRTVTV